MKTIFFVAITALLPLFVHAQSMEKVDVDSNEFTVSFLPPANELILTSLHQIDLTPTKSNQLLMGTGWLLQGLKFRSAVDEFNSLKPFDFRGYNPSHFSSYSSFIDKNQLLINPVNPLQ